MPNIYIILLPYSFNKHSVNSNAAVKLYPKSMPSVRWFVLKFFWPFMSILDPRKSPFSIDIICIQRESFTVVSKLCHFKEQDVMETFLKPSPSSKEAKLKKGSSQLEHIASQL